METKLSQDWQVAEVQLVYHHNVKPSQRPQIRSSKDAYKILLNAWDEDKIEFIEQFKVILLSRSCKVLGIIEISSGGTAATAVDVKLIFIAALKANASKIILSHNHPSGGLTPSPKDIKLTREIVAAGKLLEIVVEDHIIVTSESYISFADEGHL